MVSHLEMYIDFVCMEYDAPALATMMWPWHALRGIDYVAGQSQWARAKPFIMTSCRSDINPLTITFPKTILATDYDLQLDYTSSKERVIPIRLKVFPVQYNAAGYASPVMPSGCVDIAYFTETSVA